MSAGPGSTSLRHNRDFLILWSGEAVSELGSSMTTLVLPLIGYAISGSTVQAGFAATAAMLVQVVLRLPAGALVDRWPRDRVLFATNLAAAVLYGSIAVTALTHTLTLTQLVVASGLAGATVAFARPATSAAVRTIVAPEHRPTAYSRLQARGHAAELVGPPLGGALYSVARGLPFAVDAVSYVVAAIAVRFLRTPLPAPTRPPARLRTDVADGLRFLWGHRVVRALMLWGGIFNLAATVVFVTVTLRLVRAGVHPAVIGLVDSAAAVAGVLGALLAPTLVHRTPTGRLTLATGAVVAAAFALMALSTDPFVVGGLLAGGIFLVPSNNAGISSYLAFTVTDDMQGRLNAAAGFVSEAPAPFGPVLAGTVIAVAGGAIATLVGAALVVASLLPLLLTSQVLTLGRPDSWEPQPAVTGATP